MFLLLKDDDLIKRINDLQNGKENADETMHVLEPPSKKAKSANSSKVKVEVEDQDYLRMPNSRGQMNWNKIAINDLIECHQLAQEVRQ